MSRSSSTADRLLRIGDLRVDPALGEIRKGDVTISLEPKAMELLLCLAERAGEVVSVGQLLDVVWKDVVVSQDSVYAAVAALRRTLGDNPKSPRYIASVVRRGYRLVAPVSPWLDVSGESTAAGTAVDTEKPAIAVMPFLNLSGDPSQQYLSDGITEDIITELSRWRMLTVRSRSASFRYRDGAGDTRKVARELGVRFVVEGSVRRIGERIRISTQLVDADTDSHIWVEKFDRGVDEIFAVEDRVVQTIVSTLVGRVQASDFERARRKPPANLAAYECLLRANALSWDDPDASTQAVRFVEKAIELDPGYGFAYAVLASLRQLQWIDALGTSDAILDEAYELAARAVTLDDGESTCRAILGLVSVRRRNYDLGLVSARRAVELNPSNQWNAADLGVVLVYAGRSEEALSWFAKAREIDPYFDEPWYWRSAALAYMNTQRYAEALTQLGRARVRRLRYLALVAGCYGQLGDTERAHASARECLTLRPDFSIRQFMDRERFRNAADSEQLVASLRLAGLPE
jgi:TolB-like protein/tetratricopeptide (TPR) repeat protein